MRTVAQPGAAPPDRIQWAYAHGRRTAFDLKPGRTLLEAVQDGFGAEGFTSGTLVLTGGALDRLAYVMPARSPSDRHAAFYSAVHNPPGLNRMITGAVTFGRRLDGQPMLHCHALWTEADGRVSGGHVLADQTRVAESLPARGVGLTDVSFTATPDPETNFTLFAPTITRAGIGGASAPGRLIALRLRPNQDVALALECFCRERGIRSATLHGGVGSIIGARFDDGRRVEPFATELALRTGRIVPNLDGGSRAELYAALIDMDGAVAEGGLVRGYNPVLITLETVLEPE